MITILENANVVDVENGIILADQYLVLENGFIRELSEAKPSHSDAKRIDLKGSYVIPGLIDAHVHVTAYTANLGELPRQSPMYVAARAAKVLDGMLSRGFTTVRDVGGGRIWSCAIC